jgi:hypothetical protein
LLRTAPSGIDIAIAELSAVLSAALIVFSNRFQWVAVAALTTTRDRTTFARLLNLAIVFSTSAVPMFTSGRVQQKFEEQGFTHPQSSKFPIHFADRKSFHLPAFRTAAFLGPFHTFHQEEFCSCHRLLCNSRRAFGLKAPCGCTPRQCNIVPGEVDLRNTAVVEERDQAQGFVAVGWKLQISLQVGEEE